MRFGRSGLAACGGSPLDRIRGEKQPAAFAGWLVEGNLALVFQPVDRGQREPALRAKLCDSKELGVRAIACRVHVRALHKAVRSISQPQQGQPQLLLFAE